MLEQSGDFGLQKQAVLLQVAKLLVNVYKCQQAVYESIGEASCLSDTHEVWALIALMQKRLDEFYKDFNLTEEMVEDAVKEAS